MKKILSVALAALMLICSMSVMSFAANDKNSVDVRIEGISNCLFNGDVEIDSKEVKVVDVITALDEQNDDVTVTITQGDWGSYIEQINGEMEKTFGGFDGWLFLINGKSAENGIDTQVVKSGDEIVFYYGDFDMQIPFFKTSDVEDGKLIDTEFALYSLDTAYDENWNPIVKENVITNYTLTWEFNGKTVEIGIGEEGIISLEDEFFTVGDHSLQISKTDENGKPLVLRFADDFELEVEGEPSLSFITKMMNVIVRMFEKIFDMIFWFAD